MTRRCQLFERGERRVAHRPKGQRRPARHVVMLFHHCACAPRASTALTPSTTHAGHPRSRGAPGGSPIRRRSAASRLRRATCAILLPGPLFIVPASLHHRWDAFDNDGVQRLERRGAGNDRQVDLGRTALPRFAVSVGERNLHLRVARGTIPAKINYYSPVSQRKYQTSHVADRGQTYLPMR